MNFRIATYNVHRCVGRDGVENIDRIVAVLKGLNADIVALQEVTSSNKQSSSMLARLALETEMEAIEGFTLTTSGTRYGNAILTGLPISTVNRINISVTGKEPRGVIEIVLHVPDIETSITIWATHLGLGIAERYFQINQLLRVIGTKNADVSVLLGDFNEWLVWGRSMRAVQMVFTQSSSPATFPAWIPLLKLDRIWVKPIGALSALRPYKTRLSRTASDHLPLIADITI
ncbi:endonuclease/exonuclease/phosphatase family protein [Desulfogranum marinum]|uniref:endonuclease/exonuclease/phosphatase family protein n=1 Tax=Desulfogranum marinum TaxID=453220 RepID=UPI001E5F3AE2|nr:endonuclease/exonuclease/phosphatase family protein [Desulfogranum marinum]